MSNTVSDRESSIQVFREWLGSLPISDRVAARGEGPGALLEKAWLDEIDEFRSDARTAPAEAR